MKVTFEYNKERDMWCIRENGKSSKFGGGATHTYKELVAQYGDDPSWDDVSAFIDACVAEKHMDLPAFARAYQKDWDAIADEFFKRADAIFGISLKDDVTAYLTLNTRCPYNLEKNFFFVSCSRKRATLTVVHELWHFYTWYAFGPIPHEVMDAAKYFKG
jgi:hypothetical protein